MCWGMAQAGGPDLSPAASRRLGLRGRCPRPGPSLVYARLPRGPPPLLARPPPAAGALPCYTPISPCDSPPAASSRRSVKRDRQQLGEAGEIHVCRKDCGGLLVVVLRRLHVREGSHVVPHPFKVSALSNS